MERYKQIRFSSYFFVVVSGVGTKDGMGSPIWLDKY